MRDLDAYLFDAGGVLVLPDPTVLVPLLLPYGGSTAVDDHVRAHYRAMAAKSAAGSPETFWDEYNRAYVAASALPADELEQAARRAGADPQRVAVALADRVERDALRRLHERGVPIGVVSNASGQIAEVLRRIGVCQVGPGDHTPVRVIVDSHVVGVAKPSPAIFDHALHMFDGIAPSADRLRRRLGDDGRRRRPRRRPPPDPARPVRRSPRRRLRPGSLTDRAGQLVIVTLATALSAHSLSSVQPLS